MAKAQRKGKPTSGEAIRPGSFLAFPIRKGLFGVCRVGKISSANIIVEVKDWFGETPPALTDVVSAPVLHEPPGRYAVPSPLRFVVLSGKPARGSVLVGFDEKAATEPIEYTVGLSWKQLAEYAFAAWAFATKKNWKRAITEREGRAKGNARARQVYVTPISTKLRGDPPMLERRPKWLLRRSPKALQLDGKTLTWFTFAGGRINQTLKYALEWRGGWKVIPDNFAVKIQGDGVSFTEFDRVVTDLRSPGFWEDPDTQKRLLAVMPEYRLSKFQRVLPQRAQLEMVGGYLLDFVAARAFLSDNLE